MSRAQTAEEVLNRTEIEGILAAHRAGSSYLDAKYYTKAFDLFVQEMHGRQYGEDETEQAWQFFLAGWKAAVYE